MGFAAAGDFCCLRSSSTSNRALHTARDGALDMPTLILQPIQVNVRAVQMPPADDIGITYLRAPLNTLPVHR